MGKTESGAVWLDKNLLSTYDYWQFWRNTDDRDVTKFLKMFTDLSLEKIEEIKNENINDLKILLANEATKMLHGEIETKKVEKLAKSTFKENSTGEHLPSVKIGSDLIGKDVISLIEHINNELSKSEIRRLIKNNGIKIDNEKIEDEKLLISKKLFESKGFIKLSVGKKKHFKIII